ncbi:MAG TPA: hypothetical protein VMM18_06730 [Gemmatimonadaceae bacterium]|nr:hypothetical protein [Gemmatimonadaceae bacterium]
MSGFQSERALGDTARWISARSRNALKRPVPILVAGTLVFIAATVAFLVVPLQMNRAARSVAPRADERPDTLSMLAGIARARAGVVAADSVLERAREEIARPTVVPATAGTLSPDMMARRDSLTSLAAVLARRIERVETAPILASFRELGELPAVSADPRVRPLLDSLADVEREREVFGAAGGVDPIFVALTARATALGRAIRAVAQERRETIQAQLLALRPQAPPTPQPRIVIDTAPLAERRALAVAALDSAVTALERARLVHRQLDRRAEEARRLTRVATPPAAAAVAGVILALAAGFALALVLELRTPRVADPREVERLTGVRVIGVVRPHARSPERARRRADELAPPLITTADETYRRLYLHLASSDAPVPLVALTGEDPVINGVIGANVAAVAAYEARTTLIVDADIDHCTVAGVLRVSAGPGVAEILAGRADWAGSVVQTSIGRDRVLFVVPGGWGDAPALTDQIRRTLRDDLARMARRFDVVVVVTSHTPGSNVGLDLLPVPDVVYCAEVGRTSLAQLMRAVRDLRDAGVRVRGIVLWDLDVPELPSRQELGAGRLAQPERSVVNASTG